MPIDIPLIGARSALWIVAQLHLYIAAFVLGAPIFIVIYEYLGAHKGNRNWQIRLPLGIAIAILALLALLLTHTFTDRIIVLMVAPTLVGVVLLMSRIPDDQCTEAYACVYG